MFLFLRCLWWSWWAEPYQSCCCEPVSPAVRTFDTRAVWNALYCQSALWICLPGKLQHNWEHRIDCFMSNQDSNVVLFHWAAKERKRKKCRLEWRASISCLIQSVYFLIICRRYFKRTNIFKATVSILLPSHNLFSASNQMLYPTILQKICGTQLYINC